MTAYLLLPSIETGLSRRVDFQNIGHLFAERDEPETRPRRWRPARFVATGLLILMGALGNFVLVARPNALSQSALPPPAGPHADHR